MPMWLSVALGVGAAIALGFAGLIAFMRAYTARRRRAKSDPTIDLGARYVDDGDRANLTNVLACAALPPSQDASDGNGAALCAEAQRRLDSYEGQQDNLVGVATAFGGALRIDPTLISAWTGLAETALLCCYCHSDGFGDVYWRGGVAQAYAVVKRALELEPTNPEAVAIAARYRRVLGHLEEAEALVAQASTVHWQLEWVRSSILSDRDQPEEAVLALEQAVAMAPEGRKATLLNSLGSLLTGVKRWEEAIAAFDRALAVRPDYAWAWHNRALALHRAGRNAEALLDSDRALSLAEFGAAHSLNKRLRRKLQTP